jgi:ribosomal protein L12E/L44/L45/RPP1/RPP2
VPPLERPPEEWKSAGEPMTDSQASFLKRLSTDAGEDFDPSLSKAAASRRIDELLKRGKGGNSAASAPTKRPRKSAAARPAKATTKGGMSEAQSAYLQELAEEEGGDFDADLTKEEGARRIGELLIKQMARRSPTEPPF